MSTASPSNDLPVAEEFRSQRCLSMALIRNPDGSGFYRARVYYGPTWDYPEGMFQTFDQFVAYCASRYELVNIEQQVYEQHGEPEEPDWAELRRKAVAYTEAKRKSEEANKLYEKAVESMERIRKSKWIVPGLIRRP